MLKETNTTSIILTPPPPLPSLAIAFWFHRDNVIVITWTLISFIFFLFLFTSAFWLEHQIILDLNCFINIYMNFIFLSIYNRTGKKTINENWSKNRPPIGKKTKKNFPLIRKVKLVINFFFIHCIIIIIITIITAILYILE